MQVARIIAGKLLRLYDKPRDIIPDQQGSGDFWSTDVLLQLSFLLYRINITSAVSRLPPEAVARAPFAGITEQTDQLGQTFYYHWHNGTKTLLHAKQYTDEGAYPPGVPVAFLAYDADALRETNGVGTGSRKKNRFARLYLPALILLPLLLLTTGLLRHTALVLIALQLGCLVNGFLATVLLFKERNVQNSFTERFCAATSYTGCNKLIHDGASRLLGSVTLAQLGTGLYTGLFIFSLLLTFRQDTDTSFLFFIPAAAVASSLLLVLKMMRLRTYCRLCLWIHTVNLLLLLSWGLLQRPFGQVWWPGDPSLVWTCLVAGLALGAGALYAIICYTDLLQKGIAARSQVRSLKYELLKAVLQAGKDERLALTLEHRTPLPIRLGEEGPDLAMILSLHCRFCADLVRALLQPELAGKFGRLQLYLFLNTPGAESLQLAAALEQATEDRRLPLLHQWYEHTVRPHSGGYNGTAAPVEASLPAYCLRQQELPYEELPAVFINGVRLPQSYSAEDFEVLSFFFSR